MTDGRPIPTLEQHIAAHQYLDTYDGWESCECGWREEQERKTDDPTVTTHAAHVAATYRVARTVTTVEELDALPMETRVSWIDPEGGVYGSVTYADNGMLHELVMEEGWAARVLWMPADEEGGR